MYLAVVDGRVAAAVSRVACVLLLGGDVGVAVVSQHSRAARDSGYLVVLRKVSVCLSVCVWCLLDCRLIVD